MCLAEKIFFCGWMLHKSDAIHSPEACLHSCAFDFRPRGNLQSQKVDELLHFLHLTILS